MFKVGELVKIKCFAEIKKIDERLGINLPKSSMTEHYCGKIGKVTFVEQSTDGKRYLFKLNITKDFSWYDVELTSLNYNNFIPLQICLL